jgi:hypothetical protein
VILFLGSLDHLGTFNHIYGTNLNNKKRQHSSSLIGLDVSSLGDTHDMTTTETPEKPEITTDETPRRNNYLTRILNLHFSFNVFV